MTAREARCREKSRFTRSTLRHGRGLASELDGKLNRREARRRKLARKVRIKETKRNPTMAAAFEMAGF